MRGGVGRRGQRHAESGKGKRVSEGGVQTTPFGETYVTVRYHVYILTIVDLLCKADTIPMRM